MSTLAVDSRQIVTLEIADPEGEVFSYSITAAPPGLDEFALSLTRLDTGDTHKVAVDARGKWTCTCKSFRHRKGPHAPRGCKHCVACKALKRLIDSTTTRRTP